ncbi:uncharacterized protein ZBAI_01091 [Zygosaccharomyces bailii ISA1307]|nr:uncharacterized protein ZBAI_01091 [Zygosaccharomyces bailii ISA1307]
MWDETALQVAAIAKILHGLEKAGALRNSLKYRSPAIGVTKHYIPRSGVIRRKDACVTVSVSEVTKTREGCCGDELHLGARGENWAAGHLRCREVTRDHMRSGKRIFNSWISGAEHYPGMVLCDFAKCRYFHS